MLMNLIFGLTTMALCLLMQALLLVYALHYYRRRRDLVDNPSFMASFYVVTGVMLLLVISNLAQVAIWSLLFMGSGEFDDFRVAFYHSAVNFASLGYGDIGISEQHRLLGALEAINGVLMIGVSTAILMASFQDALKRAIKAQRP